MSRVLSLLRGFGHNPAVVGFLRGILHAALIAAIAFAINYFSGPGAAFASAPLIVLALRSIEGLIDKQVQPSTPASARVRVAPDVISS